MPRFKKQGPPPIKRPDDSQLRTLLKLRVGRRGRELGTIFLILVGMLVGIIFMALAQLGVCRVDKPGTSVRKCLAPLLDRTYRQ